MHKLNLKILNRENDSERETAREEVITKGVSDYMHLKRKILIREKERGSSVCRSSSLDRKKNRNRTEPNCKRPDRRLQLP